MTIAEALYAHHLTQPDAPAILAPRRAALTYAELFDQVVTSLDALNQAGYGRGDRIALALPAGPETATASVTLLAGCVAVPLNEALKSAELGSFLSRFRVSALMTRTDLFPHAVEAAATCGIPVIHLEPCPAQPAGRFRLDIEPAGRLARTGFSEEQELAIVFPTSGTTALPKRIPLTQANVCDQCTRAMRYLGLTPADRCLDLMPSFHSDAVMASLLSTIFAGASSAYPAARSTHDFLRWVRELNPTWCAAPPPFFEQLLSEMRPGLHGGADLNFDLHLRALFTCGAPLGESTVEEVERIFGAPLRDSYGATECGGISINPVPPGVRKRKSVGVGIGLEIRVVSPAAQDVAAGQPGEVIVRGPGVFRGYEDDPDSNAQAFLDDWYRTGDQGYLDPDGYVFLTGRIKELINRGGDKIAPQEIDDVLRSHPDVEDAAAFAVPHPVFGEDVAAVVVLKQGHIIKQQASANELRQFAGRSLAVFKVPRTVLIVSAIPRSTAGKVQRNQLAAVFAAELGRLAAEKPEAAVKLAPAGAIERGLLRIWQSVLGCEDIGVADDFFELGGHSLQATVLVRRVEEQFGKQVPVSVLFQEPTIRRLAAFLSSNQAEGAADAVSSISSGSAKESAPPVFLISPGISMRLLAQGLAAQHPAVSMGLSAKWAPANPHTLQEIAACLIQDIVAMDPNPRFLLGWGCGGTLAYEIAQQLQAAGTPAEVLLLIDTANLDRVRTVEYWKDRIRAHGSKVAGLPPTQIPRYLSGKLRSLAKNVRILKAGRASPVNGSGKADGSGSVFNAERLVWKAAEAYVPEPYSGQIVHFRSRDSYAGLKDRSLGWRRLAPALEVVPVPGDHLSLFQPPQVDVLVAKLSELLKRDRSNADGGRVRQSESVGQGDGVR